MGTPQNQQSNNDYSFKSSFLSSAQHRSSDDSSPKQALTARECEVLAHIAQGKTTKDVARTLGIKFKTVACHRARILGKLNVHNTADMTRHAISMGLITIGHRENGGQALVSPCVQRQQMVRTMQHHLHRVAELAHAEADALAGGNENVWMTLEAQLMNELRQKEQAMAALRRHREEHGC
jgi:DNA-binding CsgD family transcriptional regulator